MSFSDYKGLSTLEELERERQRRNDGFRYQLGRLRDFSIHAEDTGIGIKLHVMEVHAALGISEPTVPLTIYRWGIDGVNFDKRDIEELIFELFDKTQRPRRATFKMLIELQPKYYAKLLDMHPDNRALLDEWLDATGDELDEYKFPVPIPTLDALHAYWRNSFNQGNTIEDEPLVGDVESPQETTAAEEELSDEEITAREDAAIGNELAEELQDPENNLLDMRQAVYQEASDLHRLYAYFTCDIHPEVETEHTSAAGWILHELVRLNYADAEDYEDSIEHAPLETQFMQRLADLFFVIRHGDDNRVKIYVYRDLNPQYKSGNRSETTTPMRFNDADMLLLGMLSLSFEANENMVGAYLVDVEASQANSPEDTGYEPMVLSQEEIENGGFVIMTPLGEELEHFGYVLKKPMYLLNPSVDEYGHFKAAIDYGFAYAQGQDYQLGNPIKHVVKGGIGIYPLMFISADEETFTLTKEINDEIETGLRPSFSAIMDAVQINYRLWHDRVSSFNENRPSEFNRVCEYDVYGHVIKVKIRRVASKTDFENRNHNYLNVFRQMMLDAHTPVFQVLLPDVHGVFPDEPGYDDANGADRQPVYNAYDRKEWVR